MNHTEAEKKVTVIIPVYGDWPSLSDCISSLIECVDLARHKVLLVNDCGPEADTIESNILNVIGDRAGIEYHRNPENLGFVKNCNRAVSELDGTSNDIMLLNSDTKVTEGFLEEMIAVLYDDKKNAVVSPRSNNATIYTIPISAIQQRGIDPDRSYEMFLKHHKSLPRYHPAPTGHGFCMLIRRDLIQKYGLFDEVFGKGYGEEVDFCRRLKNHGYESVMANHAYVFHMEARSFSMETKKQLLEENNKIVRSRYPEYKQEVGDYIESANALEGFMVDLSWKQRLTSAIRGNLGRLRG